MKKTKRGFTLVELIIVIAVIGVLAAILIPVFSNVIDKANAKSALSDGRNTVEQYIIDAMENRGLPKNVLVFVKKANNMYVYGYGMESDGTLKKARDGEAYKKYSDPTQLVEKYSFNAKHPGVIPDITGATEYDEAADGSFWLVPYGANGKPAVTEDPHGIAIKGFHGVKDVDMSKYPELSDQMTEEMGDDVWVYHGYLLNGTYSLDNGEGGTSGGGGDTPIVTPAPVVKHTITFEKGGSGLDGFEASKVTVPEPVEVEEGSIFIANSYSASYDFDPNTEDGFLFDGWDKTGSTVVTGDMTVTAQWTAKKLEKYTLTFDANGGTLSLASGVTSGMKVVKDTDIKSYVLGSSASKANTKFQGWKDDKGEIYKPDHASAIIMTRDITLTAQFEDTKYDVIFKAGEGTGSDYKMGSYKVGTTINLPTAAAAGFTAPEGKELDYWKSSIAGEPPVGAGGEYEVTEAVTFTAVWKLGGTEVTVKFYDSWNEQTITVDSKVRVSGTAVNYSQVESLAPKYWVQGATTTVSIVDDTVTFTGDRHNTSVSGDAGTDYQVVTTAAGLTHISGVTSGDPTVAQATATLNKNYWLLNNISASLSSPIGWTDGDDVEFTGKFNGNGKTISGLGFNKSGSNIGLFAINTGTISNFDLSIGQFINGSCTGAVAGDNYGTITGINVTGTYIEGIGCNGGITGYNNSGATVSNCTVKLTNGIGGQNDFIGGIVGGNEGTITGCTYTGSVNSKYQEDLAYFDKVSYQVGGIAGANIGSISDCCVNMNERIIGTSVVGGAVGYNENGTITNTYVIAGSFSYSVQGMACYTNQKVYSYTGGFVGNMVSGTIRNCAVKAAVAGFDDVGGFAGMANTGSVIDQCAFYGFVNSFPGFTATKIYQFIGGFVGYCAATITNSYVYATGSSTAAFVSGYSYIGGFVGAMELGTVQYNYVFFNGKAVANNSNGYAGIGIGFKQAGTSSSNYALMSSSGSANKGFNRVTAATFKSYNPVTNWSTSYWDFGTTSQLPILKNLPSGFTQSRS